MTNASNGTATPSPDPSGARPLLTTSGQQLIIAIIILILAATVVGIVGFIHVPKENTTLLNVAEGLVLGWVGAVIAFYFPSSVGARSKDDAIATMSHALTAPTPGTTTTTVKTEQTEPSPPPLASATVEPAHTIANAGTITP